MLTEELFEELIRGTTDKPTNDTKTDKPTKTVKTAKSVKDVKTAKSLKAVKTAKSVKTVKTVKPVKAIKTVKPVKAVKTVKPVKAVKIAKPVKVAKTTTKKNKIVIETPTELPVELSVELPIELPIELPENIQHKTLSQNGYSLEKSKLTKPELNSIKKDLTVTPLMATDYVVKIESFEVFKENDKYITMPRYYGISKLGQPDVNTLGSDNSKINITFNGRLREHQKYVIEAAMRGIMQLGGGLLALPTGFGKTTLALYIASQLGLKTLVVVHKTFLQNQWYERIKQFTNARIGIIRQKKVDVEDKDIVIGMLQSISMKDYDKSIFKDFQVIIVDECFTGKMNVLTDQGAYTIAKLYDMWEKKEELPLIKSFNEATKCFEYKSMTYAWKKSTKTLVKIDLGSKTIQCTPNHRFLTIDGYKEASLLTHDDILLGSYNEDSIGNMIVPMVNDDQMQLILGSFLGDGNIAESINKRYRLHITHGYDQYEYCKWKASMFGCEIQCIEKNECTQKSVIRFNTKMFDIKEEFPKTKTTCPQWIIDKIDFRGIAVWIMDDGSINKLSQSVTILTCSFDENTQKRLVKKLCDLGINCSYFKCDDGYYIQLYEDGAKALASKIYPYLHESMKYNLELFKKYQWSNKFREYGTVRVLKISNVLMTKANKTVYDIQVDDNHNFIVTGTKTNHLSGTIVHNCHRAAARVFSQAFFKIGAKHTTGLSATPQRADGLTKVLNWFLGDILVHVTKKGDKNVYVNIFNYESNEKLFMEKKKWFNGKLKPDVQKMITNMYKMDYRNQFIANIINSLKNKDERKILVLSGRIEHLNQLKVLVDMQISEDVENGLYDEGEMKTAFYIGKMKGYELKDAEEADVIFGTYAMAEEGLDIDGLNTLILATPKKNIIQSIGRIMRKPLEDGDINPLIIDITDNLSCFKNWGDLRDKYYRGKKYTVNTYNAFNDQCLTVKEYLERKNITVVNNNDIEELKEKYIKYMYGTEYYDMEKELGELDHYELNNESNLDTIFDLAPISNVNANADEADAYVININV